MFSTVFLAEKHSIAKALADVLPGRGIPRDGYIACGDTAVTWLSGHLLELLEPEGYDPRYRTWSRANLPIVPEQFRTALRTDRNIPHQMDVIRRLLEQAPTAVNAADFDREGQLLVDEVLELVNYQGRVLRIQTKALDRTSLTRELGRMRPNEEFAGLRDAARARSQLDWLAGMNLTRAMTLHGRRAGVEGVLSLGRVQTPTLALVVQRDETIENFVPKPFWKLECPFTGEAGAFRTFLLTSADMEGCDEEKRLVDKALAERIRDACSGAPGRVTVVESKKVTEQAPLPYSLTELQKEASSRYGLGANAVLAAAQALYEARVASYPRTDCQYLPMEQFADAPEVLAAVSAWPGMDEMVKGADTTRRGAAWNTSKVKAHHAIIPTGVPARNLPDDQAKIYFLICRRYVWQFLAPHLYQRTRVDVACVDWTWRAMGRVELDPGWSAFKERDPKEKEVVLPAVKKGDALTAGKVRLTESRTTPPSRFTEGTLVDAMENIHRYLKEASKDDKTILTKTEGLGTVATRAAIIQRLFDRRYIKRTGKSLISTPLGRSLVKLCPASIRDPLMTADMERQLSCIQEGQLDCREYVRSYADTIPGLIDDIFRGDPAAAGMAQAAAHTCPRCGAVLVRRRSKAGRWFWSCSGYPDCRFAAADNEGTPGRAFPDSTGEKRERVESDVRCPRCGKKKLVLRSSSSGPFWGCGGYPDCRYTCPDDSGRPATELRPEPGTAQGQQPPKRAPGAAARAVAPTGARAAKSATGAAPGARSGRKAKTGNISSNTLSIKYPRETTGDTSISPTMGHDSAPAARAARGAPSRTGQGGPTGHACPECGAPLALVPIRRGPHAGSSAWICRNDSGHASGRVRFFDDDNGEPRLGPAPDSAGRQAPAPRIAARASGGSSTGRSPQPHGQRPSRPDGPQARPPVQPAARPAPHPATASSSARAPQDAPMPYDTIPPWEEGPVWDDADIGPLDDDFAPLPLDDSLEEPPAWLDDGDGGARR